jgi:hypothetical protein
MTRGHLTTVAILTALVLLILLASPMLLGQVYIADDLGEFHLPLRAFYAKQLAADQPFDWCPDLYCGFYLTGEGQVGGYHPLHLLLYHTMPLPLAFDLECWLSYPVILVGMVMFLRRWRLHFAAALFGAIAFTFGSFNFLHFVHPNAVAVVAHLPWLLWAMDVMLRGSSDRQRSLALVAVAALTGSQWLLGYPQYVVFSLGVEAGYLLWLIAADTTGPANAVASTLRWLAAFLLGTLLGAVQLLPTFDALLNSVRQSSSLEWADSGSLHPLNLLQLVGPYLFGTRVVGQNTHELGLYLGAAPFVLAVFGVLIGLQKNRYRTIVWMAVVAAFFAIFWAFGTYGPFGWLQANLPLLNKLRMSCRAIVVFQLAMAVLAAVGFALLSRQVNSASRVEPEARNRSSIQALLDPRQLLWLWAIVAVSVIVAVTAPLLWPQHVSSWPKVFVGPMLMLMAVGLVSLATRGVRWAPAVMIVLTAIDLGIYGMSYAVIEQTAPLRDFIQATSKPSAKPDSRVALDLLAGTQTAPGDGGARIGDRILLTGWKRVDGYAGLEPARRLNYREPVALQIAGVGWKLQTTGQVQQWISLPAYRPRAWLVTQAIVSDDPAAAISQLKIDQAAIVETPLELPAGVPGKVVIRNDRPGYFVCETDCSSTQLLVFNESHQPGWRATVDGQEAPVQRVNGDFQGVVVSAGRHEILLQFLPNSLKIGRIVSCCGLGLLVAAAMLAPGQSRKLPTSHTASPPRTHQT